MESLGGSALETGVLILSSLLPQLHSSDGLHTSSVWHNVELPVQLAVDSNEVSMSVSEPVIQTKAKLTAKFLEPSAERTDATHNALIQRMGMTSRQTEASMKEHSDEQQLTQIERFNKAKLESDTSQTGVKDAEISESPFTFAMKQLQRMSKQDVSSKSSSSNQAVSQATTQANAVTHSQAMTQTSAATEAQTMTQAQASAEAQATTQTRLSGEAEALATSQSNDGFSKLVESTVQQEMQKAEADQLSDLIGKLVFRQKNMERQVLEKSGATQSSLKSNEEQEASRMEAVSTVAEAAGRSTALSRERRQAVEATEGKEELDESSFGQDFDECLGDDDDSIGGSNNHDESSAFDMECMRSSSANADDEKVDRVAAFTADSKSQKDEATEQVQAAITSGEKLLRKVASSRKAISEAAGASKTTLAPNVAEGETSSVFDSTKAVAGSAQKTTPAHDEWASMTASVKAKVHASVRDNNKAIFAALKDFLPVRVPYTYKTSRDIAKIYQVAEDSA